jgi:hypothetical protein
LTLRPSAGIADDGEDYLQSEALLALCGLRSS